MTEPQLLGGRYEVGELLGRGGMADVRKGRDIRLGRTVAIKRLRADLAGDQTFQARFRREAQSAASLNYPAIVSVYDTGEETIGTQTVPYIVMEYVEGRTLRDVLRSGETLLPERALEIVADVLRALSYSHHAGIVHRDIKPANVMLTPTGQVKVMDFGIARAITDTSATMTQTAAVIGTAQYLSPEQARGIQVDARSDIYSTGCLLYELLTARPPFVGDSPVSVAYQHVREDPIPPSHVNRAVTPAVDQIVLRALAKDPADRYQSADDMRADLERALRGERTAAAQTVIAPLPTSVSEVVYEGAVVPAQQQPQHFDDDYDEPRRSGTGWVIGILSVILLAALAFIGWQIFGGTATPDAKAVPTILNKTEAEARTIVEAGGFRLATCDKEPSDTVEVDLITHQSPTAGESADPNTEIQCTLSTGRAETTVPQLVGLTQEAATDALAQNKLKLGPVTPQHSDRPEGTVIASDPKSGTPAAEGTEVALTVSDGQQVVPNVVSLDEDTATSTLRAAGFTVARTEQPSDAPLGTVIAQDPRANEVVANDSTVTITIAVAKPTPTPTVSPVPDVVGKSLADATTLIEAAGFGVGKVDPGNCTSPSDTSCIVKSQDPASGAGAELGSPVNLVMEKRGGGGG